MLACGRVGLWREAVAILEDLEAGGYGPAAAPDEVD